MKLVSRVKIHMGADVLKSLSMRPAVCPKLRLA